VLRNRPTPPTGVNFCLCIRWRTGDVVYRWKLWQGVGEVLNVPLYNGEIIKKNFVLECWTTADASTCSLTTAIRILTSVVTIPTDFRSLGTTALCTGTEYNKAAVAITISSPTTLDTSYMSAWYKADEGITEVANRISAWADQSGNAFHLAQATAGNKPLYVSSDADINNMPLVSFDDSSRAMTYLTGITVGVTVKHVFLTLSQETFVALRGLLINTTTIIYQDGTSPTLRLTDGTLLLSNSGAAIDTWCTLEIKITSTKTSFIVYSLSGTIVQVSEYVTSSWPTYIEGLYLFQLGNSAGTGAVFKIAEAIFYSAVVDTNNVLAYLINKYTSGGASVSFPQTINSGSAWLSND